MNPWVPANAKEWADLKETAASAFINAARRMPCAKCEGKGCSACEGTGHVSPVALAKALEDGLLAQIAEALRRAERWRDIHGDPHWCGDDGLTPNIKEAECRAVCIPAREALTLLPTPGVEEKKS